MSTQQFRKCLIGRKAMVDSFSGTIVDETRNMLVISDGTKERKFIKKTHIFTIEADGTTHHLTGEELIGRSEERIKV